jgi:hypothetical protein
MNHDPLISMALLGTARMASLPLPPDPSLEETWSAIDIEDPAAAVLQALAFTRAMHRGGMKLRPEMTPVPVCLPGSKALLSSAAVDLLMRLLNGEFPEVLSEWLGLASVSGCVLPGRVLPEMLAAATKDHSLRPLTRHLAGERGKWIAGRHQKFSWLIDDQYVVEISWEDGSPAERMVWLRQTRSSDPASAMAAVISQWSGEEVTMRESILRLISENPLPSDETWLEQVALIDRRQEVRELAAVSLVSLPSSAFRERALSRIRNHVKIQRRLLKRVILVEPPNAFDPSWSSDGIKEKPPQGTGEKAWWLRQMISLVPMDEWPELLGCSESEVFSLSIEDDWKDTILHGWFDSCRRMPARALARQIVPYFAKLTPWPFAQLRRDVILAEMFDGLSVSQRFEMLDIIAAELEPLLMLDLLSRCKEAPPAGSGKVTLAVIDAALPLIFKSLTRPQARALACCIPQAGIQARLELIAKLPELSSAAEEFATTLEFRRSLLSHFTTP